MPRSTFNLVYLCCVRWPQSEGAKLPPATWSSDSEFCFGSPALSNAVFGLLLFPWALLKAA
eukprot:scaffold390765_cov50-Prasinocladus_malaysianus.AAC.1